MSDNYAPILRTHGVKLERKVQSDPTLNVVAAAYKVWRDSSLAVHTRDKDGVLNLVDALNDYKDQVEPILDCRPNSAQEMLQPSILEEFFEYLFCRLDLTVNFRVPIRHPSRGFLSLSFNPSSLRKLVESPEFTVRAKDHDFIIGGQATLNVVGASGHREPTDIVIPAVAIECKRYLERNMLDECAGTAERMKRATPYCLYIVASEFLKMDDGYPEMTEIDEIYILRHQRNSERKKCKPASRPIDGELIWDLYQEVVHHLKKIWWDPESALKTGKVFNRP